MTRRITAFSLVLTHVLIASLTGQTAVAKGPMTGGGAIVIDCSLPDFPSPANTVVCDVQAEGLVKAFVDDKSHSGVFVSEFVGLGRNTGKIVYNQPCIIAGQPPLQGTATGVIILKGTWLAAKNLPLGHEATITIPFNWQRTGVTGVITTGKLSGKGNTVLRDDVNGQTATDLVGGIGAGVLIPLGVPASCGDPGPNPLRVLIAAAELELL